MAKSGGSRLKKVLVGFLLLVVVAVLGLSALLAQPVLTGSRTLG